MKKRLLSLAVSGMLFATLFSGVAVFAEDPNEAMAYDERILDNAIAVNDDTNINNEVTPSPEKDEDSIPNSNEDKDVLAQPTDNVIDIEINDIELSDIDNNLEIQDNLPLTFDSYEVNFQAVLDSWPRYDYAVFNLYTADNILLDSHTRFIDNTDSFSVNFSFPETDIGTILYLEVTGVDSIDYFSDNYKIPSGEKLPLYTYLVKDEVTFINEVINSAHMTIHMRTQPQINIYVEDKCVSLSSPAIFEGPNIIAPLSEIAEAIGISDCTYFPEYNSIRVETGDHIMYVNVGFSYATIYGSDISLNTPVSNINSLTYMELRPFVEAFGSTLTYTDNGDYCDIVLTKSPKALESIAIQEKRMNDSGVGSKTGYMIWVNKEKFRCSVFEGSKGDWTWVKDFTVGIGANGMETITGVFEYNAYTNMWPYASYYVGPVMVFYGNYAIHSTFLRYDGTPYDNTVGTKISHGCVRCQAKYINWMVDNLPMYTRVYVTES